MSTLEVKEEGGRSRATLELRSIGGTGRLNPRLQLNFTARPAPYAKVVLEDITLRLECRQELIGEGCAVSAVRQQPGDLRGGDLRATCYKGPLCR